MAPHQSESISVALRTKGRLVKFERPGPPVRRVPLALARRFLQICTTAAAESVAEADLTPLEFAVMAYINEDIGEPDIDLTSLAERVGIDRNNASLLVERLVSKGLGVFGCCGLRPVGRSCIADFTPRLLPGSSASSRR